MKIKTQITAGIWPNHNQTLVRTTEGKVINHNQTLVNAALGSGVNRDRKAS